MNTNSNALSLNTAFSQLERVVRHFQDFENMVLEFKKWSDTKPSIYACAYCQKFNISASAETVEELQDLMQLKYKHTLLSQENLQELVFEEVKEEFAFEAKTAYEI